MKNLTDIQLYQIISNNVKIFRTEARLTQRELAERANISLSYIAKVEANSCDQTFSISTLNQIANALDRDISEFFSANAQKLKQVDYIVMALTNLGGQGKYAEIYTEYENITGETLTYGKKAGIRKNIEDCSSDSKNFKGKKDLFFAPLGKGEGVWALRDMSRIK